MKADVQHDVRPPLPAEDVAKPPSVTPPPLKPEVHEEVGHASSTSSDGAHGAGQSMGLGPAPSTNMYDQYSGLGIFTAVVIDAGGGGTALDPRQDLLDPRTATSMVVEHPSCRPPPGPATASGKGNGNGHGTSKIMRAKSLPEPGHEGQLLRLLTWYCSVVARHPCALILLYLGIFGSLIGIAWRPLDVDSDFSAFIRADGDAMRQRDAYMESQEYLKQQDRRLRRRLQAIDDESLHFEDALDSMDVEPLQHNMVSDEVVELRRIYGRDGGRFLQMAGPQAVRICLQRVLTILYKPKRGNALDERVLQEIRELETRIRNLTRWKHICGEKVESYYRPMCNPGQSFGAFSWPTRSRPDSARDELFSISFDAEGPDLLRSPAVLAYLQQEREGDSFIGGIDRYLPKDFEPPQQSPSDSDSSTGQPSGLRSTFTFFIHLGIEGESMSEFRRNTEIAQDAYKKLIGEEVYPLLSDFKSEYIEVYYYGSVISGYEVNKTLQNDVFWAIASVSFVTCYLWLHTRSLVLSILSLGIIFVSVPLSYVLTPLSKTTIASFLSLFLVSGIGCDVVFVVTDFWEQSVQVERSTARRLTWVLLHAGRNCLATSLTTSASFFANLASCLQPLREFGLFMGLSVTGAYILVMLFLPPIVVIHDCCCCSSSQSRKSPESGKDVGELDTLAIVPAGEATVGDISPASSWTPPIPRRKLTQYALVALANRIAACPAILCCSTFLMIVGFIVGVAVVHEFDRGVPDIFPEDHNQVAGNKMQEKFAVMPSLEVVPVEVAGGAVCRANGSWENPSSCMMHWCDSELSRATTSEVSCWHEDFSEACREINVRTRLASPFAPEVASWVVPWRGAVEQATGGQVVSLGTTATKLKALVLENWESGEMVTRGFYDMGVTRLVLNRPQATASVCTASALCFWGQHHCSLQAHGWTPFGQFNTTAAAGGRRLSPAAVDSRRLDLTYQTTYRTPTVPMAKRIHISVVWGLRPAKFTPLVGKPNEVWSFDPNFEPDNPWAQRAMYSMCEGLPADLLVYSSKCWIKEFKEFLSSSHHRFPTRDFKEEIGIWFPRTLLAQENLWRAKDGKVVAAQLHFTIDLDKNIAAGELLDHKKLWDNYVAVKNSESAMSGNRAWHTAQAWVRAEAENAVVESTIDTIVISAACAWGGMLIFTCDPVLAFFVLGLVLGIIGGLAFFMVVIIGWKIGSIEVISLVIFVGYSVTYSLHVAHSYSEAYVDTSAPELDDITDPQETKTDNPDCMAITDENTTVVEVPPARAVKKLSTFEVRRRRSTMSLVHIGGAVLSSAISTIGSSIFLLCCTMIIFVKLGAVVIAVTLLSVSFALVTLPALLMLCGPSPDPWYRRWARAVMRRPGKQTHED